MTKLKGSKKYRANLEKIQAAYGEKTTLTVEEAVNTLVSLEQPNYKNGASVEIHFNLNIDPTKSDQLVRSSVSLPHGTGKEVKIAAFVGDDKNDMLAGKNASIKTVAVSYGYGKVDESWHYDYLINTPKELEKWI